MRKLNIIGIKYKKANNLELKQMFSDMIEMYIEKKDKIKEEHYKRLYQEKFGEEYKPLKQFIPELSLDKVYTKDDFERYQDYIKYADKLFRLKFNTYKQLLKDMSHSVVTPEQMIDFHNTLGIEVKFKKYGTEEAWVPGSRTDLVYYNPRYLKEFVPKEVIIHELGHIFENMIGNVSNSNILFTHSWKSSVYDLRPVEIFAEDFLNYFVSPKYLKAGWSDVYEYFNNKVPSGWKKKIRDFIKMRSN